MSDTTPRCGLVMPISEIDGLTEEHWREVKEILQGAATDAGFAADLVSDEKDSSFIHHSIVKNLHANPMVICDVSARNPNVMLELGIRLAFNKPTVIVKDDRTPYSFDTNPVPHMEYPRGLRHRAVEQFRKELAAKLKATQEAVTKGRYKGFIEHVGPALELAAVESRQASLEEVVIQELGEIKRSLRRIRPNGSYVSSYEERHIDFVTMGGKGDVESELVARINSSTPFHAVSKEGGLRVFVPPSIDRGTVALYVDGLLDDSCLVPDWSVDKEWSSEAPEEAHRKFSDEWVR